VLPRDKPVALTIAATYDGEPCRGDERAEVILHVEGGELVVAIDAPFFDDPAPPGPPGPTPSLWDYEVVELMLLGDDDRYLEVELSPHGHYLALQLHGRRNVVERGMALAYRAHLDGARWRGHARVPLAWLPPGCDRLNAFAIHGAGAQRRYLAWRPTGGERPDFHRLEHFGSWPHEASSHA
jgi:hypothetical protein